MNKIKIPLLFLASICTLGCKEDALNETSSKNENVKVELLTISDGCSIYRFFDQNPHYFVRCKQEVVTIEQRAISCGEGCIRQIDEEIPTVEDTP